MDLQKRSHPTDKVPVILPFLADAILALGGTESEGIFRIPGDGDSVSELKSRIDRGNYELVSGFSVGDSCLSTLFSVPICVCYRGHPS
jgi:hypothetical protein